jgi:ATP-dependent Clp protease ATP-binding subunit ClpA
VLDFAWTEAPGLRHESVDAEHILLGLMLEQDGAAARMLRDRGTDPAAIRAEAFRRLPSSGTQTPPPESADTAAFPGFIRVGSTPPTRRLLMAAAEQALDGGRSAFDAGDLLIAIARDETFARCSPDSGSTKAPRARRSRVGDYLRSAPDRERLPDHAESGNRRWGSTMSSQWLPQQN